MKRDYNKIQSLERAILLLEVLASHENGIGLSSLAREVDLNKTTVYRLLSTLETKGYVYQNKESSKYTLGWKLVELSGKLLDGTELVRVAREPLERLSQKTQEAVHLGVLEGDEVVYISKIEGASFIRIASRIGARMPIHCTALGKAIVAHLPQEHVRELLSKKPLLPRTSLTKIDPDLIMVELEEVKSQGYALDNLENEDGIICVAAPVFDNNNLVCAAISISGSSFRLKDKLLEEITRYVQECASEISGNLGCTLQTPLMQV